jgi:hypothetical protein
MNIIMLILTFAAACGGVPGILNYANKHRIPRVDIEIPKIVGKDNNNPFADQVRIILKITSKEVDLQKYTIFSKSDGQWEKGTAELLRGENTQHTIDVWYPQLKDELGIKILFIVRILCERKQESWWQGEMNLSPVRVEGKKRIREVLQSTIYSKKEKSCEDKIESNWSIG